LALAREGSDVVVNFRSSSVDAQQTVAEVEALGRRALAVQADISQGEQVARMLEVVVAEFGRLDVLVNSASMWRRSPWEALDEAEWDRQLEVDLKGPFLCARHAAPHLAAHGDGAILNIVDLSALMPFPNFLPHSVAKAGLANMTYGLALELAPEVRVNAIAPGAVLPPHDYTPAQVAAAAHRNLLDRWGAPSDVADAVVFLTKAPFITGVVLPVDGGERLACRKDALVGRKRSPASRRVYFGEE
jgi:NAD(P)-dependent dehydrogenase (short-subunit alcohol dehydrogenase family)